MSMTITGNSPRLPRLVNSFDYFRWREESKDIFLQRPRIWRIVKGDSLRPGDDDPARLEEWLDANDIAVGMLRACMSLDICHTIKDVENANKIWKQLEAAFQTTMRAKLERLIAEFNSLRQEKLTIDAFVSKIGEIADQLILGGHDITYTQRFNILMNGLRREYDSTKEQIQESYELVRRRDTVFFEVEGDTTCRYKMVTEAIDERAEFDQIVSKLRSREIQLGLDGHGLHQRTKPNVSAFFTGNAKATSKGAKATSKGKTRDFNCYSCGKKGHYSRNCKSARKSPDVKKDKKKDGSVFATIDIDCGQSPHLWLLDGGASRHICIDESLFDEMRPSCGDRILTADGKYTDASGVGTVTLQVNLGNGQRSHITLLNVLYMPTFAVNLVSQGAMHNKLKLQVQGNTTLAINRYGEVVCRAMHIGNLAYLDVVGADVANLVVSNSDANIWHKRLGHPSVQRTKELRKILPEISTLDYARVCHVCKISKSHRIPFVAKSSLTRQPLELIHTDVVGRMPDKTHEGQRYAVTFIDDFTRFTVVCLMTKKSEVFEHFIAFKQRMEKQTGLAIKRVRSDNGGEYIRADFEDYLSAEGIVHELTAPYTPQQNGVAERMNKTLFEQVRCMMFECGAPRRMWGEALLHAAYVINRLPTKALNMSTPAVELLGKDGGVAELRVFGCAAWVHVPEERQNKLSEQAIRAVYMGMASDTKAYKLYNPLAKTILVSRHVRFDERAYPFKTRVLGDLAGVRSQTSWPVLQGEDHSRAGAEVTAGDPATIEPREPQSAPRDYASAVSTGQTEEAMGQRDDDPTQRDAEHKDIANQDEEIDDGIVTPPGSPPHVAMATLEIEEAKPIPSIELDDEPRTLGSAMKRPDWPLWEEAIRKELASHQENNTWTLVAPPKRANVIGCRWVFKVKRKGNGTVDKYKACLVAQGFSQKHGVDYEETFAPVVKLKTLRMLIILALQLNLIVYQMDVVTAYLNGDIDVDLYMRQPPLAPLMSLSGIKSDLASTRLPNGTPFVCKLNKSLYGLKQAGRNWYHKADTTLLGMGFHRNDFDPALYTRKVANGPPVLLTLYVDDVLIFARDKSDAQSVMAELKSHFKMTGGDKLDYILGIQVTYANGGVHLSQTSYIRRLLTQFGLQDANAVQTPINPGADLSGGAPLSGDQQRLYQSIVGSIMYAATCTRPDVAFAVQRLSRFCSCPTEGAMTAAKHTLRYLKGTDELGLCYSKHLDVHSLSLDFGRVLKTYTDADFAGDTETCKSTTGLVNTLADMPFSWTSKRQGLVTDSTCYAKYVAMHEGVKEAIWSRRLLASLGLMVTHATPIMVDNEAAIQLAKDPKFHNRTKHIDIKYHFV